MKKYLITGFSGFVSKYFCDYLERNQIAAQVMGIDLSDLNYDISKYQNIKCTFDKINLLDRKALSELIIGFRPDYLLHLASCSSVAFSWENPIESFENNTVIFLNLLEEIRLSPFRCRILSVGSSEEYGNVADQDLPLQETHGLAPLNPYAVARVAQELLARIYVNTYGLDIVMTRSFNHIGPGQRESFVISSFAKQLAGIKKQKIDGGVIRVGALDLIRDFLDVRDVVDAYYKLLQKGKSGEIYNVCSGKGIKLGAILAIMIKHLGIKVDLKVDNALLRPNDAQAIIGSNTKLKQATGWESQCLLENSLVDMLDYWGKKE